MSDIVITVPAHAYQILALSTFVGTSPNAPLAVRELAGGFNALLAAALTPKPTPPSTGTVYTARDLGPDDWVYYCDTPAVEWRLQGPGKAEGIRDYQVGGISWGYFLDNVQRVRATYNGILVQP